MTAKYTWPEEAKIVGALKPAADAAGRSGRWVTVKNAHKIYVYVYVDQANAATILLTVRQASAIAGTGAKVITGGCRVWACLDLAVSDALVRQADAVNFTTDAGVKEKMVVFEIDPAALDIAGGFDCIQVQTGASNVANITSATYVLAPLRYPAAVPPSAVVD